MGTAVEVETSDVKINVANLICCVKNIFYEIWWTERVLATKIICDRQKSMQVVPVYQYRNWQL